MCGILFFQWIISNKEIEKHPNVARLYDIIKDAMKSRGPENTKYTEKSTQGIHMAFHRLATYGLSNQKDSMPIEKHNWTLICNGDIYNSNSLWSELLRNRSSNSVKTTHNDCEILIDLLGLQMDKGGDICNNPMMLRGVFGAVLYNEKNRSLIVIRDAMGVRPLYIVYTPVAWMIVSDIRVVMRALCEWRQTEMTEQEQLLCQIEDVQEFEPGFISTYRLDPWQAPRRFSHMRWWNPTLPRPLSLTDLVTQEIIDKYASMVHLSLLNAVKIRIEGAERPFGCLLSGGLDSSLVTGMVHRHLPHYKKLYTYSLGLKGATDQVYSQSVADYLGTEHRHFELSTEEMLGAIDMVIREIGTYDTTTVRASVGNYLICRKIKELDECVYLFNGDGADELMGGYLYFHNCPNAVSFDAECRRLLEDISKYDVLRSDRSIGGNGLAPRTPFLDTDFVNMYLSIPSEIRWGAMKKHMCEKYLIRRGCERYHYIPKEVLWRTKEAMSDGVSSSEKSWFEHIQDLAEKEYPNPLSSYEQSKRVYNTPTTKEQLMYRIIFERHYGTKGDVEKLVPYFWMPKFCEGATDASARTLSVYKEIIKRQNDQLKIGIQAHQRGD